MDLLLVLLSATALTALGLFADRIDRDLRGGARAARHADRDVGDIRPMRLELLGQAPVGSARVGDAPCRTRSPIRRSSAGYGNGLSQRPLSSAEERG